MKQMQMTFKELVSLLQKAEMPCKIKRYEWKTGTSYTIELGSGWPYELVGDLENVFGGRIPNYISVCADSYGPNMTASKIIAGGPKQYNWWS